MITPFLARSQTVIPARASGALNSADLENNSRTPWLVNELRFSFRAGLSGAGFDQGFGVSVQMFLGAEPLTNGYVPVPAFCAPRDRSVEQTFFDEGNFLLELDRPLYMRPNDKIRCAFRMRSDFATGFTTGGAFSLTLAGRAMPAGFLPEDRKVHLPYMTAWSVPSITSGGGAFAFQSDDPDLANIFRDPIFVNRLIGRLPYSGVAPGTPLSEIFDSSNAPLIQMYEQTFVRLTDSFGNAIIRDSTPFGVAFPWVRRAWNVRTYLPGKSFLSAFVEGNASGGINANDPDNGGIWFPMIGLVGRREVKL